MCVNAASNGADDRDTGNGRWYDAGRPVVLAAGDAAFAQLAELGGRLDQAEVGAAVAFQNAGDDAADTFVADGAGRNA